MTAEERARLEAAGWRFGTAAEFLGATPAQVAYVDLRIALTRAVKARRVAMGWTQGELARRIGSSQSRVARIEGGDPSVSLDLIVRAYLGLEATLGDLAAVVAAAGEGARPAAATR